MPPPKNSLFSARSFFSQNMLVSNWASNSLSAASMPNRGSVSAIAGSSVVRVVAGARTTAPPRSRMTLRVGERELNRFLERHVPVLGRSLGVDRPRVRRAERLVGVHRRASRLGRVLDLRGDLFVGAGRDARFELALALPEATARQEHRPGQQPRQDFASAVHCTCRMVERRAVRRTVGTTGASQTISAEHATHAGAVAPSSSFSAVKVCIMIISGIIGTCFTVFRSLPRAV